eukprot:Amastigsp_a341308_26.p5 type:complete len:133 gc:universal Amastigsp_a341308_26:708-310(-)
MRTRRGSRSPSKTRTQAHGSRTTTSGSTTLSSSRLCSGARSCTTCSACGTWPSSICWTPQSPTCSPTPARVCIASSPRPGRRRPFRRSLSRSSSRSESGSARRSCTWATRTCLRRFTSSTSTTKSRASSTRS